MAFPNKGLRKITIDELRYAYSITGNDDYIGFSIGLVEKNGQLLTGAFSYNANRITNFEKSGQPRSWSGYQRIKITPNTIRQVIEYGLENGWNPQENKGQLNLGNMDNKINLNLKEETKFPELKHHQVALNFAKVATGHVLKLNKELYLGEGEIYQIFDTLIDAKQYARKIVDEDSEIECWVMSEKDKAIFYLNSIEEKDYK